MGDLLHVQYKVTEQMEGGPLYVQDEKTGAICKLLAVPKLGSLTSKGNEPGKYGFAIFFNPDNVVNYESKVTFVAGEFRKEHLPVY